MADPFSLFQPPGFARLDQPTARGRINYYEANADATDVIVFLHGFGGGSSSYEWSKVYPAFSAESRVIAPDLPGWGFSEHRAGEYTAQDYRVAIGEFLTGVARRPATVVASSVVGALTVQVALDEPQLFERLVLVNPSGLKDFGRPYDGGFFSVVGAVPGLNDFLYSQVITSRWSVRRFLEERLFMRPERINDEMVEAYHTAAQQENGRYAAYSFLQGNFSFDLAEFLPRLAVPTAILWGVGNSYEGPEVGRRMADLNPQIFYFEAIPDVGITPQLELPAVTIGAIRRALAALAERQPAGVG